MPKSTVIGHPILRSRLHESIVTYFQKQIMSGTIAPGAKLPPERELADTLQVNRSTLREAFCKLENLELIEIRHGDGVYVKDYRDSRNLDLINTAIKLDETSDTLLGIMEARLEIVPIVAAKAAQRRSNAELEELKKVIEDHDLPLAERDTMVHRIIALASHNLAYIIAFNFFSQLLRESSELYFSGDDRGEHTEEFHRQLYEAIRDQKPDDAREIMETALLRGERKYKEMLSKRSEHQGE